MHARCKEVVYFDIIFIFTDEELVESACSQLHNSLTTIEKQLGRLQHAERSTTIIQLQQSVKNASGCFRTIVNGIQAKAQKGEEKLNDALKNASLSANKCKQLEEKMQQQQQIIQYLQSSMLEIKDQFSTTQQQIAGLRNMIAASRLWVVSKDQINIGEEIGRGAWATVYHATFQGKRVAAKMLHNTLLSSKRFLELFLREMDVAVLCQHKNIVTFVGATLGDSPVILMELMDTNLRNAYRQENNKIRISDHEMFRICHDIAAALNFLHTLSDPVIHRDVSSANVLLKQTNGKWLAKLGDFGTTKIQRLANTPCPGAAVYSAPESSDPSRHSTKMDVYSFGILFLECLARTFPYDNLDELRSHVQRYHPNYYNIIYHCINRDTEVRPTMHDIMINIDKLAYVPR